MIDQIKKVTKYRLKDIVDGSMNNYEKSAQKNVQLSHVSNNVQQFQSLKSTLRDRKVTFSKFGFRQTEMIDDKKLAPVLRGICARTRIGSMQITELLTQLQLHSYLASSGLDTPKRVLRRYAHWEWDQDEKKKEMVPQHLFTAKEEMEFRIKLDNKRSDKKLRQDIIKKWSNILPDVQGLSKFGKQFMYQSVSPMGSTKVSKWNQSISPNRKSQSLCQVQDMISELDEMKTENNHDRRRLRVTIKGLKQILEKKEDNDKQFALIKQKKEDLDLF